MGRQTRVYNFRLIEAANNVVIFELAEQKSSRPHYRSNSPNELSVLLETSDRSNKADGKFQIQKTEVKVASSIERNIEKHDEVINKRNSSLCIITSHLSLARSGAGAKHLFVRELWYSRPLRKWVARISCGRSNGSKSRALAITYYIEQSERPEGPWLVNYNQVTEVRDYRNQRLRRTMLNRNLQSGEWTKGTTLVVAEARRIQSR